MRLAGIVSELLFVFLIIFCVKKEKSFVFNKHPFSYFGSKQKTKKIFNRGLFFIIFVRILFVSQIFLYFSLWKNYSIVLFCIIAFFGALMSALISTDNHHQIHGFSANVSAIFSAIFILFVGLSIIGKYFYLGIFNLFVFVLLSILSLYLLKKRKVSSIFEILFFLNIVVWDNVMTLKLFNII